ncbi:hypothetical protein [Alteromonas sp. 14N.309.X.WAT.G.H12]|uniref:hypothetical protein n=1 Tax=Alteromonas sp. 14N.309.X.WAT.G.H12 TaxID=3120824 RepID=UPI002FD64B25
MSFIGIEIADLPNLEGKMGAFAKLETKGRWGFLSNQDVKTTHCLGYDIHYVGQMILPTDPQNVFDALSQAKGTFAYYFVQESMVNVGTDPMGFYPLYYTDNAHLPLAFSTSITHLKRRFRSLTPNWDAWNLLFNDGHLLGKMTTIKEFSRLREGEVLVFPLHPSGKSNPEIQRFSFYHTPGPVSDKDFVMRGNALLSDTMEALMRDEQNVVIPLSAGHDSRRLAATAKHLDIPFSSITQSVRNPLNYDVDTLVAKQLADMLSLPEERYRHLPMPNRRDSITQMLEKDYWTGFETPSHEWSMNIVHATPSSSLVCDGIVGDQIVTSSLYYNAPEKMDALLQNNGAYVDHLIKENSPLPLKREAQERRRALITSTLNEYACDQHAIVRYTVFNRTRRSTAAWYYPFLSKGSRVCLPYADVAFFHHGLTMPLDKKKDRLWQKICLEAINPDIAGLHSTRDRLPAEYWRNQGASYVPSKKLPFTQKQVEVPTKVFRCLERSLKERIMDTVGLHLMPNVALKHQAWRYLPLQRCALFLDWLKEDETALPVLSNEMPAFVKERAR